MFENFIKFVREIYSTNNFIPLHEPKFNGNEKKYILNTLDSTNVSSSLSLNNYTEKFEQEMSKFLDVKYAIATNSGTSALHISLLLSGVANDCEVITQSLTFIATCNAIKYCGAHPVFIDVDKSTLNMSPIFLKSFLEKNSEIRDDGYSWNKISGRKIIACMPMHTFGFAGPIDEIKKICDEFNLVLIEDSAESLGSKYKNIHTGNFGRFAAQSFNGNKIITTGGGGMILCNTKKDALKAKHLSSTARKKHIWNIEHDLVGYNYRLPNLNAALGVAQIELLPMFIENKRAIARLYQDWGEINDFNFFKEPANNKSNYWLNVVITKDIEERDLFLKYTNNNNIMTRPAWTPMHMLNIFKNCQYESLNNTEWLFERIVNVPSSSNLAQ
jgi:aminotransferase in exopolysaccharide biosynthesis